MQFTDLVASLRLNISNFTNGMNTVRRQVQQFSSALARASTAGAADDLIRGYTTLNERLHNVGLGLRDIARISSGIVVSQTFYGITRAVNDATNALWAFNESLDYAQVSYAALFNDSSLSSDFLKSLQQFSVETIFEFSDLEKMSRKLLAYGMEYENLMYIIEGLTNIGTMSGDPAALERLAVAMGQINAKGFLQAEEVRQLVNAYAPMQDILRDSFGLSDEDFGNISDLRLPANEVINAIVDYANNRFGAVSEAAMLTITGLKNRIVDTLKVMGADIMTPVTAFYKSLARYIADQLQVIHDVYKNSGLGGVFEYLVPSEEWQARIRQFIANIKNLVSQVSLLFVTFGPTIAQTFAALFDAINLVLSAINAFGTGVSAALVSINEHVPVLKVLTAALATAAAAWALFRVQAVAAAVISGLKAVLVGVASAVVFLSRALMSSPVITIALLLGATLLGLSANANNANSAISNLMKTLNSYSAGGTVADDVLQVGDAMNDGEADSEKFWNKMGEGAEGAEDAIDGASDALDNAGKAAKKASGLLSFDEVFKLKDPADEAAGAGEGALAGIKDLAGALGDLGSALVPEIPDLSTYAKDFVSSLYTSLWDAMKTIASGGLTGALIGGLAGFAIGGLVTKTMAGALAGAKLGTKIGGVAGAAFAGFWTDVYVEMEGSLAKIATGGGVGMLIGGLLGMIVGAFATRTIDGALLGASYGAGIGGLIGAGMGGFWASATEEMNNAIEGIAVGGAIGALTGGLAGLIIGAFSTRSLQGALAGARVGSTIGTIIGGALGSVFSDAESELAKRIAMIATGGAEGMLAGGLAGFILGAFVTKSLSGALTGAKYGASIGGILGGAFAGIFGEAETEISASLNNMFSNVSAASTGSLIGGLAGMIVGAVVGAFAAGVGALPGAKAGAMIGAGLGGLVSMLVSYLNTSGVTEAVSEWFRSLFTDTEGTLVRTGASISSWYTGLWKSFTGWLSDVKKSISDWFTEVTQNLDDALVYIHDHGDEWLIALIILVAQKLYELKASLKKWFDERKDGFSRWLDETKLKVTSWFAKCQASVVTGLNNIKAKLVGWLTERKENFNSWLEDVKLSITTWFAKRLADIVASLGNIKTSLSAWLGERKANFNAWLDEIKSAISTWFSSRLTDIGTSLANISAKVSKWFGELWTTISGWFTTTKTNIKNSWDALFDTSTWKSAWSSVSSWFSQFWKDIANWFSSLGTQVSSWWKSLWSGKNATVSFGTTGGGGGTFGGTFGGNFGITSNPFGYDFAGHATGGIFNREHLARFAEGNKAEAVIPLEDNVAMRPFVNAISDGILQGLLPAMATSGGSGNDLPPMYVGTLIADERGLEQLYKKFELYSLKERNRKGLN